MKRKVIYLLFLSIGLTISSFLGCGREQVEYIVNADIIYKNNTPYHIYYHRYDAYSQQYGILFEVPPYGSFKKEIRGDGGNKVNTPEIYKGVFGDFQDDNGILIKYDDQKCLIYEKGSGSTTDNYLNSYQWRKINNHYFEFTYTFTEEEAQKATTCP